MACLKTVYGVFCQAEVLNLGIVKLIFIFVLRSPSISLLALILYYCHFALGPTNYVVSPAFMFILGLVL